MEKPRHRFRTVSTTMFAVALIIVGTCLNTAINNHLEESHKVPTCVLMCAHATPTNNNTQTEVFYAGVSYLGDASKIDSLYPYAILLNDPNLGTESFDARVNHVISSTSFPHLKINTGLANLRKGESIVLSLAIEHERMIVEELRKSKKVIFEVGAQLLFIDFKTMSVVASYPVNFAFNDQLDKKQDVLQVAKERFNTAYFGSKKTTGLINLAFDKLKNVKPLQKNPIRLQVANMSLSDKLLKKFNNLPNKSLNEDAISHYLAQYFTSILSNSYELSVLPFSKGYAIGNTMAGRFANGDVYQLKIPQADFVFDFHWVASKKVEKPNHFLFGSRVDFSLTHAASKKREISGLYHYSVPKAKAYVRMDELSAYEDAVEELLKEIAQQLLNPKLAWHMTHAEQKKSSYLQFKQKQELFSND